MAASCARRSRAAATNFIARVICWVFFTERMRRRKIEKCGHRYSLKCQIVTIAGRSKPPLQNVP